MNTTIARDESDIRALVTGKVAAMRDRDAERIAGAYADDVVMYNLAPPLLQTAEYARSPERVRDWFAGFTGQIDYEVRDLEITIGGDIAYCHSLNRLTAVPNEHPDGFSLWFRATYGLRKADGSWRIAHEHESVPFYMEYPFRAAVDLEP